MKYELTVELDDDPMSPREWDNLGIIVASHRRYDLADSHAPEIDFDDFESWEGVKQHLAREHGAVVVLPVYMIDHGGIALSTEPFACAWDSGQVGLIYASKATLEGIGTPLDRAEEVLRAEVQQYSQYVQGGVFQFYIKRGTEIVESCSGFYDEDDARSEGEATLKLIIEHEPKPCVQPAAACIADPSMFAHSATGRAHA
jgi:hypothetical protein